MMLIHLLGHSLSTPLPPPGPACVGEPLQNGTCPHGLVVHSSACDPSLYDLVPLFHPGSKCNGENDPNGPLVYDGVYHLFFQDHVPMQVGGHVATEDFVTWRRLPVALWNDRWWDKSAVWTFSATAVNGVPTIIYPGIVGSPNVSLGDCGHGPKKLGVGCFTHAVAVPADLTDKWLVDWTKPDYNPIVTGIDIKNRDPSTAWRTAAGEWRYMDASANIYSSWDFVEWSNVGNLSATIGTGDCPDFFPVPRLCDGCADGDQSLPRLRPTHVRAGGFAGTYDLGTYTEGPANTTGSWTPLASTTRNVVDGNSPDVYYAAKSFQDGARRIVWGWVSLVYLPLPFVRILLTI